MELHPRTLRPKSLTGWMIVVAGLSIIGTAVVVWAGPFRKKLADAAATLTSSMTLAEMTQMPGKSHQGPLPELTAAQATVREQLQADLQKLAGEIGERNTNKPEKLAEAASFIEKSFTAMGYTVARLPYDVKGRACLNLAVEIKGQKTPEEIVVVGAHYDSAPGAPGANDNGSGAIALLALARAFAKQKVDRTLRFVAFTNEEPPYFQTEQMGSLVYARQCKQKNEKITAMISLETIGCFSDKPNSQRYPFPFNQYYPNTGNFIGFIGNIESKDLVHRCITTFRNRCAFPSEGATAPGHVEGVGWSDQWSFWKVGYPALMLTDTALFRYADYHQPTDTPDKVNCECVARIVTGLEIVVQDLATTAEAPTKP